MQVVPMIVYHSSVCTTEQLSSTAAAKYLCHPKFALFRRFAPPLPFLWVELEKDGDRTAG